MPRALVLLLLGIVAAGCGTTTKTVTVTTTVPATTPPSQERMSLRVYFLRDGKVQPVAREVPKTKAVATAALASLLKGLTKDEQQLGLDTATRNFSGWLLEGNGILRLEGAPALARQALAQVVFTLTQFPTVKAVEIDGKRYTRADFEDETPSIAVEWPLPFQHVTSPLHVTGTANTFEATFEYELLDPGGKVLAQHFVTATSGSGTRGTFDVTISFEAPKGLGKLVVFERSAADGSRIHQGEIPLTLAR
jgi:hypothetical protein